MNKKLFNTRSTLVHNTVNEAGGKAFSQSSEHSLAQVVVTGCFNSTFYANQEEQLSKIEQLAEKCSSEFIAKCAVYGHTIAKMKDTPAYLLAVLVSRGERDLVQAIFNKVISNTKMLCNFVQMIRSGKTGRKSFGTHTKSLINNWLNSKDPELLFKTSVGLSNPSIADVIKMTHTKPISEERDALYGYLIGNVKKSKSKFLPKLVKEFESFKENPNGEIPKVDFRQLSNIELSDEQWMTLAESMPWNQLRMNLNVLNRHNVFLDKEVSKKISNKLRDRLSVKKYNAFPYQLLTTYQNASVPKLISNAVQDAMEIAVENVPSFNKKTCVMVDVSGSMSSPVTGRSSASSKTSCVDVASLIASCVIRNNDDADVVVFDTEARLLKLNPKDSIITNAEKIGHRGGGTDCASAIRLLNLRKEDYELLIMVSDNQSWRQFYRNVPEEWKLYKSRVKSAKLVLIDIQPYTTTQQPDGRDVLNIGGWSDNIWEVISDFANGKNRDFVKTINEISV